MGVGEHLDLDVPGLDEHPLEIDRAVGERRARLAAGRLDAAGNSSAPATARIPLPPPPAAAFTSSG